MKPSADGLAYLALLSLAGDVHRVVELLEALPMSNLDPLVAPVGQVISVLRTLPVPVIDMAREFELAMSAADLSLREVREFRVGPQAFPETAAVMEALLCALPEELPRQTDREAWIALSSAVSSARDTLLANALARDDA